MAWGPRNRGHSGNESETPGEEDPGMQAGESVLMHTLMDKLSLHMQAEWGGEVRFLHRRSGQGEH